MQAEVRFLDSLQGRGIRPGLQRMKRLLRAAGNPERRVPSIIVAGTNGKGSTASTLSSILTTAGYRTAFYSSPHLVSLLERWRIDGASIDAQLFRESVAWLRRLIRITKEAPTYFEALTLLAFYLFDAAGGDVSVLEVGMGGRLDATNVTRPLAALITPVGLDHTEYLGRTLKKIAREKAGVIHRGTRAFTSNRDDEVLDVLKRRCVAAGAELVTVQSASRASDIRLRPDGLDFALQTERERYSLHSPLPGAHQVDNLSLAVVAAEALMSAFPSLSTSSIEEGVTRTEWRGRLERFRFEKKQIVIDGAHNGHAAVPLASYVEQSTDRPRTLVFGVMHDKDIDAIATPLIPLFDEVIVTEPDPQRAEPAKDLAARIASFGVPVRKQRQPAAAIRAAMTTRAKTLVIAGSLYLAGSAIAWFDRQRAR